MRLLPQLKACQNKAVKPLVTFFVKFSREKVQIAIRCKAGNHAPLGEECVQVIFFDQLVAFVLLLEIRSRNTKNWTVVIVLLSSQWFSFLLLGLGVIFLGGVEESLLRIVQTSIASPVSAPLSSFLAPATLLPVALPVVLLAVNITSVFGPKSNGCVL
jgi:hypothetical protein